MPVIYKTLFDIKLMHEYYLTKEDGTVVFSEVNQPGRLGFLEEEFKRDKPSINDDISFEFPEKMKDMYRGFFLKLIPSYSGCRVVVRVNAHILADHSVAYEPFVTLPDDLNIYILINRKNFNIDAYSNTRINRALPSVYFFSNLDILTPRSFPFLTTAINATDGMVIYEQGELSLSAGGKIQEYYIKGNLDPWNGHDVTGAGFAGERDRLIVPESFPYVFSNPANLTAVTFALTDYEGNEATSVTLTHANGIPAKTSLDFSGKIRQLPPLGQYNVNEYVYTLHVSGNNGYEGSHRVIFSNQLIATDPWAVINIRADKGNGPYTIFSNDNFIQRRKDGAGVWNDAPVFEIPVKSRLAYWRFINNRGKALNVSPALLGFVEKKDDVIETLRPRSLAMHSFMIKKDVLLPAGTAYVPNPSFPGIKIENDKRLFFDLRVPNSELFPEVP